MHASVTHSSEQRYQIVVPQSKGCSQRVLSRRYPCQIILPPRLGSLSLTPGSSSTGSHVSLSLAFRYRELSLLRSVGKMPQSDCHCVNSPQTSCQVMSVAVWCVCVKICRSAVMFSGPRPRRLESHNCEAPRDIQVIGSTLPVRRSDGTCKNLRSLRRLRNQGERVLRRGTAGKAVVRDLRISATAATEIRSRRRLLLNVWLQS